MSDDSFEKLEKKQIQCGRDFLAHLKKTRRPNTCRTYHQKMKKLVRFIVRRQASKFMAWFDREETALKKVCESKSRDKFSVEFLRMVRDVSIKHNESPKVRELAAKMREEPESFKRGATDPRNMLLTVLVLCNWVRPCGLYNLKISQWEARTSDGNNVVVHVSEHKTDDTYGPQPVVVSSDMEMLNR